MWLGHYKVVALRGQPLNYLHHALIYLDKMLNLGGFNLHNTRDAFGSFANKVKEIL